jgi:hypothetical protein
MEGVPAVGGTRGIFEIFVPGAFLFLNIIGFVHVWSGTPRDLDESIVKLSAQPVPAFTVLVCSGYLLGIVLHLLKTRAPDKCSGYFLWLRFQLKRFCLGCLPEIVLFPLKKMLGNTFPIAWIRKRTSRIRKNPGYGYYLEDFPYFSHLDEVAEHRLPKDARQFCRQFWRRCALPGNNPFFNYCKTIINSLDPRSAAEIYAAEALSRYVAGMFYALVLSFCLMLWALITISRTSFSYSHLSIWVLLCIYLASIVVILGNLRPLRVKEVEMVFAAALRNYYSGEWPRVTTSRRKHLTGPRK